MRSLDFIQSVMESHGGVLSSDTISFTSLKDCSGFYVENERGG